MVVIFISIVTVNLAVVSHEAALARKEDVFEIASVLLLVL